EGVAYKLLKVGASAKPPALRIATPVAVPLVSSSNFDCSQVRVPSANAVETSPEPLKFARRRPAKRKRKGFRALCNFIPRSVVVERIFRLPRLPDSKPGHELGEPDAVRFSVVS